MAILKTENLTHYYNKGTPFETVAIRDINFQVEPGEFVGVIGHTGSGKSTLMQHFNGLLRPDEGKIFINGEDLWADPKAIRKFRFEVGLVFQYPEYQLFEETVYKDIAFGPGNMGLSKEEIDLSVREAADIVGLSEDLLEASPFDLSGGQKRRVAIAGVLAMKPKILVLDEPTAGLDPQGRFDILSQVEDYHKNRGGTVILVSHSMEDVARYADRVLVLNNGETAFYDTVDGVFSHVGELLGMGLEIPEITQIFHQLQKAGISVPTSVYTPEQGKEILLKLFGEKGGVRNA